MGTNYYAIVKEKPVCNEVKECSADPVEKRLHIGKSSCGWCFALRIYPERGLVSLESWKKFFRNHKIVDEYGKEIHETEMVKTIMDRGIERPLTNEFLSENHAERGPNNLARTRVGHRCVGHGLGPWDYFLGEFS